MLDLLRRTIGFCLLIVATYVVAKNDWMRNAFESPEKILALLGILLAAAGILLAIVRPSSGMTIVAIVLTALAVLFADKVFPKGTTFLFFGAIAAIIIFWVWVVLDANTIDAITNRKSRRRRSTTETE